MTACVPWEPDFGCCDEWATLEPELQERAETLAWSTLRVLTAGRVGNCPITMRPCLSAPCSVCNPGGQWMMPFIRDGNWYNAICGTDPCSCERLCEIVTPGPIAMLTQVTVDGTDIPLDNFRVDNGNHLVRTDGNCWPSCQDMNLALTEPGTVGITYVPGIIPDAAGLWAAGVLACEFAKACSGKTCRLPSTVTSVSRQGVTMTMGGAGLGINAAPEMFPGNMTGIREVDAYIATVNPYALKVPPMVWSPDLPATRHRYTTWAGTP